MSLPDSQASGPGVAPLVFRPRFASASRPFWFLAGLGQVIAAVSSDGRVVLERRPSGGPVELVREFGVDPAIKRRPVLYGAVLLASVATGILIAWPIVTALLDF